MVLRITRDIFQEKHQENHPIPCFHIFRIKKMARRTFSRLSMNHTYLFRRFAVCRLEMHPENKRLLNTAFGCHRHEITARLRSMNLAGELDKLFLLPQHRVIMSERRATKSLSRLYALRALSIRKYLYEKFPQIRIIQGKFRISSVKLKRLLKKGSG